MAKFMILYNASQSARETMANTNPEEMKASMEEWIKWRDEASKTAKVDWGLPLQPVSRLTPDGVKASDSDVSGYAIIEADSKDTVVELLKNHPHLKRADASIDVLEMLPMPGM
jgi:hypothetical protein